MIEIINNLNNVDYYNLLLSNKRFNVLNKLQINQRLAKKSLLYLASYNKIDALRIRISMKCDEIAMYESAFYWTCHLAYIGCLELLIPHIPYGIDIHRGFR